jgi:hypothetical protein
MAKITPILILLAIVAGFWFAWAVPLMIAIWCLFFLYWINFLGKIIGRRRWYIIPKGWNYSTISLLDMVFIWNRLTQRRGLSMTFYINPGMLEQDDDDRFNKLGGVRTSLWEDTSIRLGFRAIDKENYVVATYKHEDGRIVVDRQEAYSYQANKYFTLHVLRENNPHGLQYVEYWIYDSHGTELDHGKYYSESKMWSILLPYWEDMTKKISVEVSVI